MKFSEYKTFIKNFRIYHWFLSLNRVSRLNILLGIIIWMFFILTPDSLIQPALKMMGSNAHIYQNENIILLFIVGFVFLGFFIFEPWAVQTKINAILYRKKLSEKLEKVSLKGFGILWGIHMIQTLVVGAVTGALLGALIEAKALIPIMIIGAMVKEVVLYNKVKKIEKNPQKISSQKENLVDAFLLFFAVAVLIITWEGLAGKHLSIDIKKGFSSVLSSIFITGFLFLLFYVSACWIWVQESILTLNDKKGYLYFGISLLFDVLIALIEIVRF